MPNSKFHLKVQTGPLKPKKVIKHVNKERHLPNPFFHVWWNLPQIDIKIGKIMNKPIRLARFHHSF